MRRSSLITISALGLVICLFGGTGLFAALQDTATTGQNEAETAPLAGSADLQLAEIVPDTALPGFTACGTWVEDLATGLFDAQNLTPGGGGASNKVCIRNVGSQTVGLTLDAFDLTDTELACTGDEADYGDLTCGSGAGELSAVLQIRVSPESCADNSPLGSSETVALADLDGTPVVLLNLVPNDIRCYGFSAALPDPPVTDAVQRAQSDRSTWRFRFIGTAPAP